MRARTVTPSLVVTLLVGTSAGEEDFGCVPLVVEGASVVREAPGVLMEDMWDGEITELIGRDEVHA